MLKDGITSEDIKNSLDLLIATKKAIQILKKSLPMYFFLTEGEDIGIGDIKEIAESLDLELVESEWEQSTVCKEELSKRLHFEYDGTTFCNYEYKRKGVEND